MGSLLPGLAAFHRSERIESSNHSHSHFTLSMAIRIDLPTPNIHNSMQCKYASVGSISSMHSLVHIANPARLSQNLILCRLQSFHPWPVSVSKAQCVIHHPSVYRCVRKENTEGPLMLTSQVSAYPQAIALDLITVQRCQEALRRPPFGLRMDKLVQISGIKAPRVEKPNDYLLRLMLVQSVQISSKIRGGFLLSSTIFWAKIWVCADPSHADQALHNSCFGTKLEDFCIANPIARGLHGPAIVQTIYQMAGIPSHRERNEQLTVLSACPLA